MVRCRQCRLPRYSISTPESDKCLTREMCLVTVAIDLSSVSLCLSVRLMCVCVCIYDMCGL